MSRKCFQFVELLVRADREGADGYAYLPARPMVTPEPPGHRPELHECSLVSFMAWDPNALAAVRAYARSARDSGQKELAREADILADRMAVLITAMGPSKTNQGRA